MKISDFDVLAAETSLRRSPSYSKFPQLAHVLRPVVHGCWIAVRSVRPHKRFGIGIISDLIGEFKVAQGPVQFALENRPKVDGLLRPVLKANAERVTGIRFRTPGLDE